QLLQRFLAVCQTMACAHSKGIIHRDLKPANVMLGQFGETLVVDWGLAKSTEVGEGEPTAGGAADHAPLSSASTANAGPTQCGHILGTPAYMSPEQAGGQWDLVGPASDIYCLGAILYEVLTGRAPLCAFDPIEALAKAQV